MRLTVKYAFDWASCAVPASYDADRAEALLMSHHGSSGLSRRFLSRAESL